MKWFLQFLGLGSAVLYTLLVIIDNGIPRSTVENTVISQPQSKQRRLSVWDPYLPYRSFGQDRQASLTTQPAHQQIESLAPEPNRKSPREYFDGQPASDDKLTAAEIDGSQIGKRPASLPGEENWFVVSRAARLHAGPSVFFPCGVALSGWHRMETSRLRARLVSSFRSGDIATRMDLRKVLSRCDQQSRPDPSQWKNRRTPPD